MTDDDPPLEVRSLDEELTQLLRAGQLLLVQHPVAARQLVRAFVAEGRRFAATDEGRAWREALSESELIRRGRLVWEGCSLNMLEEEPHVLFPSVLLEAIVAAAAHANLESLLSKLFLGAERP